MADGEHEFRDMAATGYRTSSKKCARCGQWDDDDPLGPCVEKPKRPIDNIRELVSIQCSDGNWNSSKYMRGMANGMIFALSCLEGGVPEYLGPPAGGYLSDKGRKRPTIAEVESLLDELELQAKALKDQFLRDLATGDASS